jgi:hypothetical protein
MPWAKDEPFQIPEPYSKPDIQEYLELCSAEVEKQVPLIRLEDGSGFSWLPFTNSNYSSTTFDTYNTIPGS